MSAPELLPFKERAPNLVAINRLVTAAIDYGVFCERHGDMSERALEAMRSMNDERTRVLALAVPNDSAGAEVRRPSSDDGAGAPDASDDLASRESSVKEASPTNGDVGAIICAHCGRKCASEQSLRSHLGAVKRYAAQPRAEARGCNMCGGRLTTIRSRYPHSPERIVCPTCLADRIENARDVLNPQTYEAQEAT